MKNATIVLLINIMLFVYGIASLVAGVVGSNTLVMNAQHAGAVIILLCTGIFNTFWSVRTLTSGTTYDSEDTVTGYTNLNLNVFTVSFIGWLLMSHTVIG